jgi:hypothetical protein
MVNRIRLGGRPRKEKIAPHPHVRRPVAADEQAPKKPARDMFSYFVEFCDLEGFERGGARDLCRANVSLQRVEQRAHHRARMSIASGSLP